jgi:hypothetical protein
MATLPPPPSTEEPSGTTTTFPPPTGAQIIRALRAPLIGYAWLLLGAVVMVMLIVVAANVGSTGDETGVESDDTNAIGVLIGMPFQIAGMALLGSLHFTEDGARASLFLPPLILTALYLVMTARAARRGEMIPATGTRALLGIIVGFTVAVVLTPATWALAMRENGAAVHTASVSLFFGVWALTGVASYVGTSRGVGAVRPVWIPSDYAAAARLWFGSVMVWVVVAVVVLTVVAAVKDGLWVGILAPLWGVTVALYTYAIGHLGSISLGGEGIDIGDFGMVWTIVLIVGALVLAALTSIAWHLRRDIRETSLAQPGSWAVLPATYAVGGIVVWLVPTVVLGGGLGEIGASAALQPAFWFVFVLIGWGAVVEVASRFVAPSLAAALPPRLHALLRGPGRVDAPTSGAPVGGAPVGPEARPLTPEERARYKRIGIAAGALVVVGVVGWVSVSVINSKYYGPEDQVAAYLDAVVDGDLDEVNDLAPTDADQADDSLLTSKIYRAAESRITGYKVGDIREDGDTVTAEVRLEGLGKSVDAQLTMEKSGHTAVLFDKWRVADGGLAKAVSVSLPEGAGDLTVNHVAVDRIEDDVWLLPGDYVFDAFAGNRWLESSGEPVTVSAGEDYQYAEVPGAVASDAFREEVQRQIDAYLATCIASTELQPANCPNSAYGGSDVRKVKWTLDQAPTPDFDSFDGTFPADLSYGESGRATVTYEADESYGFGPPDWKPQTEESDLYLSSVTVTENGDSLLVTIDE